MEDNLKREVKTNLEISQKYEFELIRDGKVIDSWDIENLVTTEGLNTYIDYTLKTGQATPLWYVGLKNTGTPVAGDTMASHGSWTENVTYSEGTRPAFTPGTVSGGSVSNTASKASFSINGTTTIFGAFLTSNNTKSGTTGILLGVGDFGASRSVLSGDTLNVTVTCTITSA
jgi:hypothetical protein